LTSSPQRTCFGCGRKAAKSELIRLAVDRTGRVVVDLAQRAEGRGVYVCPDEVCLKRAAARRLPQQVRRRGPGPSLGRVVEEAAAGILRPGHNGG